MNKNTIEVEMVDISVENLVVKNYVNVKIEEGEELFNNEIEIINIDKENNTVELRNTSEIKLNETVMIDLEVRGKLKITHDLNKDFEDFVEKQKVFLANPLFSQSSLIISFISDKVVGTPLITPPTLWSELTES